MESDFIKRCKVALVQFYNFHRLGFCEAKVEDIWTVCENDGCGIAIFETKYGDGMYFTCKRVLGEEDAVSITTYRANRLYPDKFKF